MIVSATEEAARHKDSVTRTGSYEGHSGWLVLFGVGAEVNDAARKRQLQRGGKALLWDLAYFHRSQYFRMSINSDHPQQWFDRMNVTGERWESFGIPLRDEHDPDGHIVLVGLGRKSRKYLRQETWEAKKLAQLRQRFPGKRIVFRPKKNDPTRLDCEMDTTSPIEDVIRGASLIVCRHSNVAVDGIVANIPFEAEDGAATWLKNLASRQEFLNRLAWWQWTPAEAKQAWEFAKAISS